MFAAWYFFSLLLTVPVMYLLDWLLQLSLGKWIVGIEPHAYRLEIITNIAAPNQPAGSVLSFELNSLSYGYGLPFLLALIFASPSPIERKFSQALLSWALVLLPLQVLGLAILSLKTLAFHSTAALTQILATQAWQQTLIALAYQFSSLVLPALSPLLLWLFLYPDVLLKPAVES